MKKIYVEATPLLDDKLSGIGHALNSTIEEMSKQFDEQEFKIVLVVPFDKMSRLKQRTSHYRVGYKSIPLPARALYLLWKFNLVPPLDIYLGKGVYIFPNFRNWPLLRSKSLTYIHDLVHDLFPYFVSPPNRRFLQRNMPKWLKRSDLIIAVSKHTRQDIIRQYKLSEEIVKVVYNGVDLSVFRPRPQDEIAKVKAKYGLPKKYLMFFSTIEPRKNVEGLLEAYSQLPAKTRKEHGLLLVGAKGWLVGTTVNKISDLQSQGLNIVWPQIYVPDEDLPPLLSGATALVHPAFYEGFGISPLQAMACKTPVIVARNSSVVEVVAKAGLFFKAEDAAEMGSKIEQLLGNPQLQAKLAEDGFHQAQKFTWQHSVATLKDIIVGI